MSIIILGPQRPESSVARAVDYAGVKGPVGLITAGWRYDEAQYGALAQQLNVEVVHMPLYAWYEAFEQRCPDEAQAIRTRQRSIRGFKDLYRVRLHRSLEAVVEVQSRIDDSPEFGQTEFESSIEAVRALDARVGDQLALIRQRHLRASQPWLFPLARRRHEEMKALLNRVDTVVVAGGHVAILRNRMAFFGLEVLLDAFIKRGGNIICWSAGAMVLSEQIVLFYDQPPEGTGEAEVFDGGFGLLKSMILFPHSKRRLRVNDPARLIRLASRFSPNVCVGLGPGAFLSYEKGLWWNRSESDGATWFSTNGDVGQFEVIR